MLLMFITNLGMGGSPVDEGGFSVIRNNPMIVSVGKLMNR
ncbi:hypothetical protein LCGC14_1092400 [marine sediment metagenome]|uniref:Uncharacterized protein n=1 Tax=marine sediment metagenome TaxID=412755 RepID=A0A0F9MGA2_9ZZZZ